MYYRIYPNPFHDRGIINDPTLPSGINFSLGKQIDPQPATPLVFQSNCDPQHPPRDYMGSAIPVCSRTLLAALRAAGIDNLQTFPATISGLDAQTQWTDYHAVNIVGQAATPELLNRDLGLAITPDERSRSLFLLILNIIDPAKTDKLQIFRLNEHLIMHDHALTHLKTLAPPGGWGIQTEALTPR